MRSVKHWLLATAAAVAVTVGAAGSAMALTAGSIPGGAGLTNQGVFPIYGTNTRAGYYGGDLYLIGGPATITIDYFGSEAGFNNSFSFAGALVNPISTGGGTSPSGNFTGLPLLTTTAANVASGLLPFSFSNNGSASPASVVNGANIDGSGLGSPINFFVSFTANPNATFGQSVDLWLDDGGADGDDNHDDMMIRLSLQGGTIGVVPIPAALPLMLTALGGLGLIARRRKSETV